MDKEDAVFKRVSPEFQQDYGRIVWVQTSNMNPWWPCFVFNPTKLPSDLKLKAAKLINKNHAVYFYGDTDKFDFVTPHQMQDYVEKREEYGNNQKMSARIVSKFQRGVEIADAELTLPADERVKWKEVKKPKPKRNTRRSSTTTYKEFKQKVDRFKRKNDKAKMKESTKKKRKVTPQTKEVAEEKTPPSDDGMDEDFDEEVEHKKDEDFDEEVEHKVSNDVVSFTG